MEIQDHEIWNLKSVISEFIAPRLRKYIEKVEQAEIVSLPNWVLEEGEAEKSDEELMEIWAEILREMLVPFDYETNPNKYEGMDRDELTQIQQRGLDLFAKYFHHLWD